MSALTQDLLSIVHTKTFWVGVITIATGVIMGVFDKDWAAASDKILFGLAIITGRAAIEKNGRS